MFLEDKKTYNVEPPSTGSPCMLGGFWGERGGVLGRSSASSDFFLLAKFGVLHAF